MNKNNKQKRLNNSERRVEARLSICEQRLQLGFFVQQTSICKPFVAQLIHF